jgi:kinesin family member 2/24
MDQFLVDNTERYHALVKAHKPAKPATSEDAGTESNPDIIVCTRLRPILETEAAAGVIVGAFRREAGSGVDIHELRKHVKWGTALNVSDLVNI